ncbi:MAG: SRPBCC family protein [Thermoflavifilum sp.]|nr:SRPBCC family protein [Thermoflavifilum sp.]
MNIPINEDAPVKTRNQIEINAPIDTVWEILTDIHNWPTWQKAVTKTEVFGEIKVGTKFNWKANGLSFKSKIHTVNLRAMFGWTGKTLGASAIHNWILKEKGNQTIVIVEESLQGVLPRLFRNYFQKSLNSGVMINLRELKTASESR